jgi:integrase
MRTWLEKRVGRTGTISYRLRYVTPDGIVRSETVRSLSGEDPRKTHERARLRLAELQTDVYRGDWAAPAETTLGQAVDDWLALRAHKIAPATIRRHRFAVAHVPRAIADLPLDKVTGTVLQRFYLGLAAKGMPRESIRNVHKPIAAALAHNVRLGVLRANPAAGVTIPGKDREPGVIWTPDQVGAFLDAVASDERFGALYRLAFTLGLRRGELLALRRRDVDLDAGVLSIRATASQDADGRQYVRERPKTDASRRDIALPPVCLEALRTHFANRRVVASVGLVFHRGDGNLVHPDTLGQHFAREARRLGLPRMRLHDARHCAATALKRLGVHPWIVADILGHGSTAMSLHYAHGTPDAQRAALEALERAYRHDNTVPPDGGSAPNPSPKSEMDATERAS